LNAWQSGDRDKALTVANRKVVDSLFAIDPKPFRFETGNFDQCVAGVGALSHCYYTEVDYPDSPAIYLYFATGASGGFLISDWSRP